MTVESLFENEMYKSTTLLEWPSYELSRERNRVSLRKDKVKLATSLGRQIGNNNVTWSRPFAIVHAWRRRWTRSGWVVASPDGEAMKGGRSAS